jgi:glycosyltransferase involved in cell wall biosynthesis
VIGVIVPVYNQAAHLEELLQAVLASRIRKEMIIVDDGSTDGAREKLRALQPSNDITIVLSREKLRQGSPPFAPLLPTLAANMC